MNRRGNLRGSLPLADAHRTLQQRRCLQRVCNHLWGRTFTNQASTLSYFNTTKWEPHVLLLLDQVWQFLPLLQTSGLKIVVVRRASSSGRSDRALDEQQTLKGTLAPYLMFTKACVTLLAASFHWPALVESRRTGEESRQTCQTPDTKQIQGTQTQLRTARLQTPNKTCANLVFKMTTNEGF